jgi:putative SOS response-associated peptidase YedK
MVLEHASMVAPRKLFAACEDRLRAARYSRPKHVQCLVPRWWSKPLKDLRVATFNARGETVETKPVFRDAFKRTRCLIPMSGYYEWQTTPGGKQPWYFTAADGSPFLTAAGLWDEWKDRATGD